MPKNFDLQRILRSNIKTLEPYKAARDEYKGTEGTFLDANENALGSATHDLHNRYPDPLQWQLKRALEPVKGVKAENMFIGNGSDEAIDLLFRSFCRPGIDNVITTPPTYGMYDVSAHINDVQLQKISLTPEFQLITSDILAAVNENTRIIILCSPNNPTANALYHDDILQIIESFDGIVALDEAYIDFAIEKSFLPKLHQYPNLVIMQTFSKAWGMANLRLGMAFASEEIIHVLNKVKPPYNISGLGQNLALEALQNVAVKDQYVAAILEQRGWLENELKKLACVVKIYPSDANFMLVKTTDGRKIYDFLIDQKVIVRDRSSVTLCEGCLRITVGTPEENKILVEKMKLYKHL